ncbi:hypothetical protein D3C71_1869840 [compost metagenome]
MRAKTMSSALREPTQLMFYKAWWESIAAMPVTVAHLTRVYVVCRVLAVCL